MVGIYAGSFNPLHSGHIHVIEKAKSLCDELYIIIYNRGNEEFYVKIRYRWIYSVISNYSNCNIIILDSVDDDNLNRKAIKESEIVKSKIGKPIDIVFCGSDYINNSSWLKYYPNSEIHIIDRDEISSSKIRENPYKHWEWIPKVVRPFYVKKILLFGTTSTGKTTLAKKLAKHYNTNFVEEIGRGMSLRSGSTEMMIPQDYTEILLQHKLNEIHAINESNKVLFIDTDAIITKFFMEVLNNGECEENIELANAIDKLNEYDAVLFLEPDIEFIKDGQRNEKILEYRKEFSDQLKKELTKSKRNFVSISGTYDERLNQAIEVVDRLLLIKE